MIARNKNHNSSFSAEYTYQSIIYCQPSVEPSLVALFSFGHKSLADPLQTG